MGCTPFCVYALSVVAITDTILLNWVNRSEVYPVLLIFGKKWIKIENSFVFLKIVLKFAGVFEISVISSLILTQLLIKY